VRHPLTPAVQQRHDLLRPRTGRGNHADTPARDGVGEAETATSNAGGAGAGPHRQPPDTGGVLFQRDLLLHAHVVAEQQDVQPGGQGLVRFECGVLAGDRHDGDVRVAEPLEDCLQGTGLALGGPGGGRRRRGQCPLGLVEHVVHPRRVGCSHCEHEIVGGRCQRLAGDPLILQRFQVGRRAHQGRGEVDALRLTYPARDRQELYRVDVAVAKDTRSRKHGARLNGRSGDRMRQ
jgi:hypothetical protein